MKIKLDSFHLNFKDYGNSQPSIDGSDVTFLLSKSPAGLFPVTTQPLPVDPVYYFEVEIISSSGCYGYFGIVTSSGPVKNEDTIHYVLSFSSDNQQGLRKGTLSISPSEVYLIGSTILKGLTVVTGSKHGFLLDQSSMTLTWIVNGTKMGNVPMSNGDWYFCVGMWCCETHHFRVHFNLPIPS